MLTKQNMLLSLHKHAQSVAPAQEGLWEGQEGLSRVAPNTLHPQKWAGEVGGTCSLVRLEQL